MHSRYAMKLPRINDDLPTRSSAVTGCDNTAPPSTMRRSLLVAALSMGASRWARSATIFPARPVTIEIPYSPGSGNDLIGRVVAPQLSANLRQPVVVENRPGASGYIATEFVRREPPNGYRLVLASVSFSINPYSINAHYGLEDFTPVAMLGTLPFTLMLNPAIPASNMKELADVIRARPGKLFAGQGGPTGTTYFLVEALQQTVGAKVVSVPYRGSTDAMLDLLSGRIDMLFAPISTALMYYRARKVRVLGVTGNSRAHILPEVPTFNEKSFPKLDISTWFGLLGPAGLSTGTVATLAAATQGALQKPAVIDTLLKQGIVTGYGSPSQLHDFIANDMAMWKRLVSQANLNPS
ncbi:Bug family tripartite tricarboxylate transporter substrate binding protein [Paraburkholderia tropica]|uniref:Bug family tripartite tricarboxylate transporter substrate binding protein n=1 Tax=Paraburkholderia tropica TaxID=92647 RepID=UPI002AB6DAB7|nr:tripartite tricarboxylate transporter substrate-binding protein [Paraburkholderia tropica]